MLAARKIAILVNPTGKSGRISKLLKRVIHFLKSNDIQYSLFNETWAVQLNDFTDAWVIGGDGTLNYFLNFYKEIKIPIVIFSGGTGNDFAWKLYGDISIEEQLQIAINAIPKYVDAAQCNGRLFINGVGIGFDGEVVESMKAVRFVGGHLGYLLIVLKKIFSFKEYRYCITVDSSLNINDEYLLVSITNSSRIGGGFHVSPVSKIDDGKLDVVLCDKLRVFKRLHYLPVVEKGKYLSLPFIHHYTGVEVNIICEKELPAHIDGELIRAKEFQLKTLPAHFLFRY